MRWKPALELIDRVGRVCTGAAFLVVIFAVLVQVLGRSVFLDSPVWTEELTRYGVLYLAAFGAGLSYRTGDLVNVDIVCEALPPPAPWVLRLVSAVLTAVLCGFLIVPAWTFTSIGSLQTSPALGWRMDFIHASVLVLLASLLVFSLARILAMLTGESDGLPESPQDIAP